MKIKSHIVFFITFFVISCGSDRIEVETKDVLNINNSSILANKNSNTRLIVDEQNKCGGGISFTLNSNSQIPYYTNAVYFWNYDESLQICRNCKDLPNLIVNYINSYYNSSPINFQFLPGDPNYPNPSADFNAIDASGNFDLHIFQTVMSSIPASYWDFPLGAPLQSELLNAILQNVLREISEHGNGRRVNAILMYYDSLLCNVDGNITNGLTIEVKYK